MEKGVLITCRTKEGYNVKAIREGTKLGIDSFAACMGVTRKMVEMWERGHKVNNPTAQHLLAVAEFHPKIFKNIISKITTIKKVIR